MGDRSDLNLGQVETDMIIWSGKLERKTETETGNDRQQSPASLPINKSVYAITMLLFT